jgi:MFS family permease
MEPGMATLHLAAICLPEGLIFLFSVVSDTVTLFGSPRRGYIILMSLAMIALSIIVANYNFSANQTEIFTLMVGLIVFTRAWLAPVIESLMVIQIKKDPDYGAEDLETFGTFATALGQVFYCFLGGWMMFWSHELKPDNFFYLIAATGIVLLIGGLIYPTESDDISPHYAAMSTSVRFKTKLQLFAEALELPEIKRILFFFLIVSIVAPNLEEFLIYYNAG